MAKIEVMRWKTNGHKSKYAHAFRADDVTSPAYDRRALCGAVCPAYFSTDSQKRWALKRITCPKCKALASGHTIEGA